MPGQAALLPTAGALKSTKTHTCSTNQSTCSERVQKRCRAGGTARAFSSGDGPNLTAPTPLPLSLHPSTVISAIVVADEGIHGEQNQTRRIPPALTVMDKDCIIRNTNKAGLCAKFGTVGADRCINVK
ncbi:hypothetical protein XENOCAPTIV_010961 [Xenoophorus captivus]|uniref:Uncharacterized protein n=1 Tax=Xenoophorus captivus TaxID=1517983 RepID=A0ABV0QHN6_9TELE